MAKLFGKIVKLAAIGLLSAGAAFAQDTAQDPAQDPAQTTGQTTDQAQPDLPLGEAVSDVGTTYDKQTYGDWTLRCVRTADGLDPCQLYQLMFDDQGNSVAEISLFELGGDGPAEAGATIATPLETLLTEQITIGVDGGRAKRYPFSYCSLKGCFARIGLTHEDVAAMKAGTTATLQIVPVATPGKPVSVTMSLKGFTKGYAAVAKNNREIAAASGN